MMKMIRHLDAFQYFNIITGRSTAHYCIIQKMIRHAIKDYSPVYWPLVTMVEQSAFLFHINHFLQIKEYLSVSSLWETFIFHPLQNALRGRFFKRNAGRLDIRLKKVQETPLYSMLRCGFCETASETDNETFPIISFVRGGN